MHVRHSRGPSSGGRLSCLAEQAQAYRLDLSALPASPENAMVCGHAPTHMKMTPKLQQTQPRKTLEALDMQHAFQSTTMAARDRFREAALRPAMGGAVPAAIPGPPPTMATGVARLG